MNFAGQAIRSGHTGIVQLQRHGKGQCSCGLPALAVTDRLGVVGGAMTSRTEITARQLIVIVPRGATPTQITALNQAQIYARTKGVTMVVRQYP